MGCFVSDIEHRMTARELAEWRQYEELEPFGQLRDNFHAAQIAYILANANRKPGSPPIPMSDFFYTDAQTLQEQNDKAMIDFLESKVEQSKRG